MALKKKDDGFEAIRLEAEENGINLSKAANGTYSATIIGGASLDEYDDARSILDDMLAIQEMDEKDDLYAYDNGPMGGYQVAVTGNDKPFEAATLAGAFAMAKESLIPKVVEKPKRLSAAAAPAKVSEGPMLSPTPSIEEIDTKDVASSKKLYTKDGKPVTYAEAGLHEPEAEILAPTKPNGAEKATMRRDDLVETLAQGYLDLASLLTTFATTLRSSPGTIPFVQQGFAEGDPDETEAPAAPAPARSRITRERRK
jgi:hypothetical protein